MDLRTFLILLLCLASPTTFAAPKLFPRLIEYLPPANCAPDLSTDTVQELISLLDLSHPLLRRYLEKKTAPDDDFSRAFHVDARMLVLIYGDQEFFDFRNHGSALKTYRRELRAWSMTPTAHGELVGDFVNSLTNLDWTIGTGSPTQVYLVGFPVRFAFRTDQRSLWKSPYLKGVDFNDSENISLHLHQKIYELRHALQTNPEVRRELTELLSKRLMNPQRLNEVTRNARHFVQSLANYVAKLPAPGATP